MTELEKALSGEQFNRRDAEVAAFQAKVKELLYDFNHAKVKKSARTYPLRRKNATKPKSE